MKSVYLLLSLYFSVDFMLINSFNTGPNRGAAITFANSSTKNMIEHLQEVHNVNRDGAIPIESGQVLIESAFRKTRPQIIFNVDLFRDLLLWWMILKYISFS